MSFWCVLIVMSLTTGTVIDENWHGASLASYAEAQSVCAAAKADIERQYPGTYAKAAIAWTCKDGRHIVAPDVTRYGEVTYKNICKE